MTEKELPVVRDEIKGSGVVPPDKPIVPLLVSVMVSPAAIDKGVLAWKAVIVPLSVVIKPPLVEVTRSEPGVPPGSVSDEPALRSREFPLVRE